MRGTILPLVRIIMSPKHVIRMLPIHVLCRKKHDGQYRTLTLHQNNVLQAMPVS